MKRTTAITLLAAFPMLAGTFVTAGENKQDNSKKQTTCPVMGGKIDKAQYVDVKGYRIYVCCPACKGKIKADPDTYIKKLKDEGVKLEKTPKKEEVKAEDKQHDHSGHQH